MNELVLIAGVSGAGKSTLESALKSAGFMRGVTSTTRARRDGEIDGVDYHFVSRHELEEQRVRGELVEFASVNGNLYGMSEANLRRLCGKTAKVYLVLDPQGVHTYQTHFKNKFNWCVITVFIDCPFELRVNRISSRIDQFSTGAQFLEVAERLAATKAFEGKWGKMINANIYIPVLNSISDRTQALKDIEECSSGHIVRHDTIASIAPITYKPDKKDILKELRSLKIRYNKL